MPPFYFFLSNVINFIFILALFEILSVAASACAAANNLAIL